MLRGFYNLYDKSSNRMKDNLDAMEAMKNPLSPVKMVRETYSLWLQRHVTEVQVQFADEPPAWIPYETLLAMQGALDK